MAAKLLQPHFKPGNQQVWQTTPVPDEALLQLKVDQRLRELTDLAVHVQI